jgi:tetratricopeptide (TPR) repeat protein/transposase-like protein
MKVDTKTRTQAVKDYLSQGSLRKKAAMYKIHRNTLWRWVRWYKEGGTEKLIRGEHTEKHWRRTPEIIEDEIVGLKELIPSLTVRKAQDMLKQKGIQVSTKCIWGIWQRHGLIGFVKERLCTSYREYQNTTSVSPRTKQRIKKMISEKNLTGAAKIINSCSVFPYPEIIKEIPEQLLSTKRQVDRLSSEFGAIPLSVYRRKAEKLRMKLEKQKMYYSSLRAGIEQGYALMWLGEPKGMLELVSILRRKTKGLRDSGLCFTILLFEGHALGTLLRIPEALKCVKKCKIIIRNLPDPCFFMGELTGLYSVLGYYREAISWATKALKGANPDYRKHLLASLAGFLTTAGDYRAALKVLKEGRPKEWDYHSRASLFRAFAYLDQGDFQKASAFAVQALVQSKKEEIRRFLHLATFILACCHAAMGEKKKAEVLLRKYNTLFKKYRLEKEYLLRKILLGDTNLPKKALLVPNLRLAYLSYQARISLKAKDYQKALRYARSRKLFGLFERLVLFYPEPVVQLLKKGKSSGLPRAFLKMPAFQIEPFVYHLRFLGRFSILKGEKPISRLKLSPKDRSFIIHLSISKVRKIALKELYRNFWSQSLKPARNLSHLLVRIKRNLSLPSHLIRIHGDFLRWDFYFTTDYKLFGETLAQAKALKRAGEWVFAKKEYLRAFALFRGEPFKKMYDPWSEHMRGVILNELESEAIHFAKSCLEHGNKKDVKKVLEKVVKIIPYSGEIKALLEA